MFKEKIFFLTDLASDQLTEQSRTRRFHWDELLLVGSLLKKRTRSFNEKSILSNY
jgi:hypothetical protein